MRRGDSHSGKEGETYHEPPWVRFLTGGFASCTAEVATFPIDTVKVRMQVTSQSGTGVLSMVRSMLAAEGVGGFFKGLRPALLRQGVYSGIKMGLYEPIRAALSSGEDKPSFLAMFLAGGTAGAVGIVVANPADLVKTRLQADAGGGRYKCMTDAFRTIYRKEGIARFWTGLGPNVQRAFVINAAELSTYDKATDVIVGLGAGMKRGDALTILAAGSMAGLACSVAACPVDVVKNRLMNQEYAIGTDGKPQLRYSGMVNCFVTTVKQEGFFALYRGLLPFWGRCGPWSTVMFVAYENYRSAFEAIITA